MRRSDRAWAEAVAWHRREAEAFAAAAEALDAARWTTPRAEGRWSPAEETEHLSLAYEMLLRELETGTGAAIRTTAWQRLLLRVLVAPRLLRGGPFPKARAPREIRPAGAPSDRPASIARFRSLHAACLDRLDAERLVRPRRRLTHPYFGTLPLVDVHRFLAAHAAHHRGYLPSLIA